jgi:hypothetical protein
MVDSSRDLCHRNSQNHSMRFHRSFGMLYMSDAQISKRYGGVDEQG